MKLYIKSIIVIVVLTLFSTTVRAQRQFNYIYQLDGEASTSAATGTVIGVINGNTGTLTVTPADGKYIEAADITIHKTMNGAYAQTRDPNYDLPVEITPVGTVNPTGETQYTFDATTDEKYDFKVIANFKSLIDISNATVTLADGPFYYNKGEQIKPTVISVVLNGTTIKSEYYEVSYLNNVNPAKADDNTAPKALISSIKIPYTGEVAKTFTINEAKMEVTAEGYTGTYDNKPHGITITVTSPEGAVVKYGTAEGTYNLTENPTYKDAGTYTVYYQVTKENYETTTGSATVKINKATPSVTAPTAKENLTYTGGAQELINAGSTTGGELQYSLDNATYSTSIPTGTQAKEYTVYYKVVGGTNYEDVAANSIEATISAANMTVSATGFDGTYDKNAHSITVTVTSPEGAVVKYGTTEGTYELTENPTYTDAGIYTVYYKVMKDGYETTTGSATVKINKATPTVTAPTAKENLTYSGEALELINAGSTTGGELQYSLDNETYSTSIPTGTQAKEYTVYYKVVGGTNYEDVEAASIKATISEANMTVAATGFEGTYDKGAHSINVKVTSPEGAVVKYGTTEGTYELTENPAYTDAGTYTVYYQVTKNGYETTIGNATVKINKATPTVTAPTAKENLTYTGEAQELINAGSTTGGELQYSLDNENYSTSIPKEKEANEYIVYYKVVGNTNYEDVEAASIKVTISEANMTVSATGYEGAYDGKAHHIAVTVTTPAEDAVVKYGTTEGTYNLTENPTYSDAGTYTVYYQVTKENYTTVTGSKTVVINKATPSVTAPTAKENLTYSGEALELINTGSTTGGELQYSLDNETYSTSIPTGTQAKEYTVYYKVVGGTNYEDATAASIKVTISEANMTVAATGFEGVYDKKAHGITVTVTTPAEGAVVKYGTTEGTYDLTENPTYTDAGTYTVYYQVTKDGYETTTGNATVKISRAAITPEISVTGWIYGSYDAAGNGPSLTEGSNPGNGEVTYYFKTKNTDEEFHEMELSSTTDAGTYLVIATVAETGNYEGGSSKEAEFVIAQYDLANATVTLDYDELVYNGEVQTVNVTKVMAGDIEVDPIYYEVSGNTGKVVKTYSLTVTATTKDSSGNPIKNNFKGSKTVDWVIKVTAKELGLSEDQPQATYYIDTEDLEVPDGVVANIITGVSDNKVTSRRVRNIPKGVPVFLELTTSSEDPLPDADIPKASDLPLKGTAEPKDVTSISGGTVYVLYKGEFVKSTSGTIPAHRCYLLLPNNVAAGTRAFGIIRGVGGSNGSTAIKSIEIDNAPSTVENWYDMRGRRIEKPTKTGIYIKNGKIVVINNK